MIKKLAKIRRASLEIKERGILNFWITVDYEEGGTQGIGGIALDTFDKKKNERIGTAYGCEMIRRILLAFEVNDFSELKDKCLWVYFDNDSWDALGRGIQPLYVDSKKDPLIFADVLKEFEDD